MNWSKLINNGRERETTRDTDTRNDFESDFGRVIFSPAVRRMHDKTQVFPLTDDDNIHSRLTHSFEVMSVGHGLAISLCERKEFLKKIDRGYEMAIREIPVIVKNACIVHDIGNPPFGHFGETAIQNFFSRYFESSYGIKLTQQEQEDFTFFDGNAQGFRVLTKLQKLDDAKGLNLTYGTLGAYLKYPNYTDKNKAIISKKKRGVFQSEIDVLNKVADECGLHKDGSIIRHPLCYLMEAADSICYLVMDIEDGFNKQWYGYEFVKNKLQHISGLKERMEKIEREVKNQDKLAASSIETTKMVKLRIALIHRLVSLAADNFEKNLDTIMRGEYNKELILDDSSGLAKELAEFCYTHVFPHRDITSLELTGNSVLTGIELLCRLYLSSS